MQVYDISNQVYYGMTHKTNQPKTFREEFAAALPASIKQVQQCSLKSLQQTILLCRFVRI